MKAIDTTRRTFLGGAASTAAVMGPLAVVGGSKSTGDPVQRPLLDPTPLAGKTGGTSEMDRWSALVGQRVIVSGSDGETGATLAFAKPEAMPGVRPKAIRQQPMTLAFTLDRAIAAGDAIFEVTTAAGPRATLFMQPRADSRGAARLVALLN